MRFLSGFKHFYYSFDYCYGVSIVFLSRSFFFETAHICKDLQKSCRSAQIRKDRKPGLLFTRFPSSPSNKAWYLDPLYSASSKLTKNASNFDRISFDFLVSLSKLPPNSLSATLSSKERNAGKFFLERVSNFYSHIFHANISIDMVRNMIDFAALKSAGTVTV